MTWRLSVRANGRTIVIRPFIVFEALLLHNKAGAPSH